MAHEKNFKILSIDGGGVRGILPTVILQWLESHSQKAIHESFDLIVGTSTGGLIALGLSAPNAQNKAAYKATDLLNFYKIKSANIFSAGPWHNFISAGGLFRPKYQRQPYDDILQNLFKDSLLSQALTNVVIPTYSLLERKPKFYSSFKTKINQNGQDFFMRDIAAATSAAPTYFPPKEFSGKKGEKCLDVDAGLYVNNPESLAIAEAFQINPLLSRNDIYILSIGTGKVALNNQANNLQKAGALAWLKADLIDTMMGADSTWYQDETSMIYPHAKRIQFELPLALSKMDNASKKNIDGLIGFANDYVKNQQNNLEALLDFIA